MKAWGKNAGRPGGKNAGRPNQVRTERNNIDHGPGGQALLLRKGIRKMLQVSLLLKKGISKMLQVSSSQYDHYNKPSLPTIFSSHYQSFLLDDIHPPFLSPTCLPSEPSFFLPS